MKKYCPTNCRYLKHSFLMIGNCKCLKGYKLKIINDNFIPPLSYYLRRPKECIKNKSLRTKELSLREKINLEAPSWGQGILLIIILVLGYFMFIG